FAVVRDFKSRHASRGKSMDERGQWAVPFAGKLHRFAIAQQPRLAFHDAITTFGLKTFELPRKIVFDVFAPEHRLEFRAADFASKLVHLVVGDGPKLALHIFRQQNAELTFEQIRHPALAGLRIHTDDFVVFAPDVLR